MTGKQIIEIISEYNLEDFDIEMTSSNFSVGFPLESKIYKVTGLEDIGHSDKVAVFGFEEGE